MAQAENACRGSLFPLLLLIGIGGAIVLGAVVVAARALQHL